jgi:hypothetical protein
VFNNYRWGKAMDKKPLIGVSICAVVLLILGSLSNVVGYQSVKSSNQNVINNSVNQKELLFQTICDIANNKEIQQIILKSQMSRGIFPSSDIPVLTKNQLKQMYLVGLMLSKIIGKSKIHSMLERYHMSNQAVHKEINAVIEKDAKLNGEMTQLSEIKCDCGNENTSWNFPVICTLLIPIVLILFLLGYTALLIFHFDPPFIEFLVAIVGTLDSKLNCYWTPPW